MSHPDSGSNPRLPVHWLDDLGQITFPPEPQFPHLHNGGVISIQENTFGKFLKPNKNLINAASFPFLWHPPGYFKKAWVSVRRKCLSVELT